MKNFKVIEKSRLNEFTMAKLIGGRPCNERNTNCGATIRIPRQILDNKHVNNVLI